MFFKTNNCFFCNKITQDFAEFWETWGNFKAKTKTEDEGILRKGKRSSSWFFTLHIGLAELEENQMFCHAKHATPLADTINWIDFQPLFALSKLIKTKKLGYCILPYLRASHSKKFDFLLVPLTQYGVKKIMKMTVFLFSKFLHLPFLFWP